MSPEGSPENGCSPLCCSKEEASGWKGVPGLTCVNIYSFDKCHCSCCGGPQSFPPAFSPPQPQQSSAPPACSLYVPACPPSLPATRPSSLGTVPAFLLSPPSVLHPRHPEGSSGNPDLASRPHLGPSGAPVILCHAAKPQHWVLPTVGSPGFLRQHAGPGTLAHLLGFSWKLPPLPSAWSTHLVQGSQRPRFSPAQVSLTGLHTCDMGPCRCPRRAGTGPHSAFVEEMDRAIL